MDPFSHALLGAASGQSIRRTQVVPAALAGAAGALLPDADVLIGSETDPLLTLEFHRQFSHALLAAPFGALIVAGVLWVVFRRRHAFFVLYWPALVGYLSACLLDACTSYGTQLLWPFSDARIAASIVAVIDPLVTAVLLTGVVLALRRKTPKPARIAVLLVLTYLSFGWFQRERAEDAIVRLAGERGHAIAQHEVKPTLGNLILWRSVYLTDGTYAVDAVRVGPFSAPQIYPGGTTPRVRPIDLVPPLSPSSTQAQDVVRFAEVSDGFLTRHPELPNVIGDVRYAMLPDSTRPLWGIEIDPEREDRHVALRTFRTFSDADRERFLDMLLGRL